MRFKNVLCSGLFGAALVLCALLSQDAVASAPSSNVIRFGICGNNIRGIGLTQSANTNAWHLEITLNGIATKQFRRLPNEENFSDIVELDWDGVSLGRVRFTSAVGYANVSDAKYIHLQSRSWHSLEAARAQMELLGRKDLDVPCGPIRTTH